MDASFSNNVHGTTHITVLLILYNVHLHVWLVSLSPQRRAVNMRTNRAIVNNMNVNVLYEVLHIYGEQHQQKMTTASTRQ